MRIALVLLLIHGLVPSLGEVVEAVVHYAVEGHLAHTIQDQGDLGEQGHEHGCGTTEHHCDCCASQVAVVRPGGVVLASSPEPRRSRPVGLELAALHEPTPPFRPPIQA